MSKTFRIDTPRYSYEYAQKLDQLNIQEGWNLEILDLEGDPYPSIIVKCSVLVIEELKKKNLMWVHGIKEWSDYILKLSNDHIANI